jgi:hypothetical protein
MDESGVTTEMTRRYGRAPGGERVCEGTPGGHWRTLTVLGAFPRSLKAGAMEKDQPRAAETVQAKCEGRFEFHAPARNLPLSGYDQRRQTGVSRTSGSEDVHYGNDPK